MGFALRSPNRLGFHITGSENGELAENHSNGCPRIEKMVCYYILCLYFTKYKYVVGPQKQFLDSIAVLPAQRCHRRAGVPRRVIEAAREVDRDCSPQSVLFTLHKHFDSELF